MPLKVSTEDFVRAWEAHGSPVRVAEATGLPIRAVYGRASSLRKQGYRLETRPAPGYAGHAPYAGGGWTFPREKRLEIDTGSVVVFSDAHFQPGEPSTAHKALLAVIAQVKPRVVIANGDIFDGGSIGRHPPFGWADRPTPVQELHACQERMGDIEQVAPRGCELVFTVGNHDVRWERTLASQAEQFRDLFGMRLTHHFPAWELVWSAPINWESRHPVMVKHRYASGIHSAYNNTQKGGVTMVTGHTHALEVKPIADYRGRRWGVQTGSLADLDGPAFEYTENSPSHACSGFAVLTFRDGQLLPPELCEVINGQAIFRGEVVA